MKITSLVNLSVLGLLALGALTMTSRCAQATGQETDKLPAVGQRNQWQQIIDDVARRYRFRGSISIQQKGVVVAQGGYGTANSQTNEANTPNTRFRIGSVSKQFAAVAVLQLEEAGRLRMTDTLGLRFPSLPAPIRNVTIHQMLSHQSGITDYKKFGFQEGLTIDQLVDLFKDKPLDFPSGSKYKYSNSNYIMAGYVVEKLSGIPYAKYLDQYVFGRAGMPSSGFEWPAGPPKGFAWGYSSGSPVKWHSSSFPHAAGALYSTAVDMASWFHALATNRVLSATSMRKMGTAYQGEYGYGVWVRQYKGRTYWWHGGFIPGYLTVARWYPAEDIGISVTTNDQSGPSEAVDDAINQAIMP
jgi:CubicO group peptidase (beta-lactamase class C family)